MSMISEFVEKLVDRLEEKQDEYFHGISDYEEGKYNAYDEVAQIVNQLAEEYKDVPDTNVGKWIPVSEKMPEEKFCDDGYVEPSDTVLVFTKYGSCKVSRYWGNRRNKRDYYDWVDIDYRKNEVLAWQPLPEPYKGE